MERRLATFAEFCPYYLSEHRNRTCRRLHFVGSTLALACLVALAVTGSPWWLAAALVAGYGSAGAGNFLFGHNRPATFRHPRYSFVGDRAMFRDMLTGRIPF